MLTIYMALFTILNSCETKFAPFTPEIEIQKENTGNTNPDFPARVIRIVDGDTLEVMYGELPVMIRLQHIDAPEKRGSQPFGNRAKQALSDLCFGQNIQIKYDSRDRNGRYICVIFNESGINVNQEMLKLGMAWHYKKYSNDGEYHRLEEEARQNKIGLWVDPDPTPPWLWRK